MNHGPFGEKNFFIPNGHWPYGPGRAMGRLLPVAGHAVNQVWAAGVVLAAWIWVRTDPRGRRRVSGSAFPGGSSVAGRVSQCGG